MRRFLLPILLTVMAEAAMAAPVTWQQARQKASEQLHGKQLTRVETPRLTSKAGTPGLSAPYYIFNAERDGGYVIVSGDDATDPILGYADKGNIDPDHMPDNMKAWLEGYAQQIGMLSGGSVQPARVPNHTAIATMLTCSWDQTAPFNNECPLSGKSHCVTGCVATAMAQVMYYHQWPQASCTTIPEYTKRGVKREALPPVTFNWSAMRDTYDDADTDEGAQAVATLMHYCGRSVQMGYALSGSDAISQLIAPALTNYFGYDPGAQLIHRDGYSAAEWDALIYAELAAGRPVLYCGSATDVGHQFVCDGYDGKGNYHINWGWSGYLNGYFKLSILNPDGTGTGGSSTTDGYTFDQNAVIGVQKPTGQTVTEEAWMTSSFVTTEGSTITFDAHNKSNSWHQFELGMAMVTGTGLQLIADFGDGYDLDPGYYYPSLSVDASLFELPEGTFYLVPVSRVAGTEEWRSTLPSYKYVEVVVSGSSVTCTAMPLTDLAGTLSVDGNLTVGASQEVELMAQNKNGEFYGPVYLFASMTSSMGSAVNMTQLTVEAGATAPAYLYFTPDKVGTWNLWVTLDEEGKQVLATTQVTINPQPTGKADLEVKGFTLSGKTVTATILNKASEPYSRELIAFLFDSHSNYNIDYALASRVNIPAGETAQVNFTFDGLKDGEWYEVDLYHYPYYSKDDYVYLDYCTFTYKSYPIGDVNHDGKVNVTDVMLVVNHILGNNPQNFYENEAELTGDNKINVSDIMAIVNIILKQ